MTKLISLWALLPSCVCQAIPFSPAEGQHPSKAARGAREPAGTGAFPLVVPSQLAARMEKMDFTA